MKTLIEFYETPETRVQEFLTEGVLCSSMSNTTVDDYVNKDFEW
jgi:hypothetical protein